VYHLEGTTYQQAVTYKGDEGDATIMSRVLSGFALSLADVFAEA
jgi:hypothetical protein